MYKSLQTGRGVAALMVVLFHLGLTLSLPKYFGIPALSVPFSFGDAGVEFFFVLSGFIIFLAHQSDISRPERLLSYASKRMIRIYPTYWIIFLAVFLLAELSPSLRATVPHDLATIVNALLLIPVDSNVVGGTGAPVITVAWTLQYEMFFYLVFALLIASRALGIALLVAFIVLHVIHGNSHASFPLSFLLSDFLWLFLMGAAVAIICIRTKIAAWIALALLFVGLALFLMTIFVVQGNDLTESKKILLYGFAFSLIVLGLVQAERNSQFVLGNKYSLLLGDLSYALYLIHLPLISILSKLAICLHLAKLGLAGALIAYFCILLTCIAVALAFHSWVEKPVAGWLRHRVGSLKPDQP